ncbi:MAG: Hpt domain-containing protein [Lawsonibacter sp.]|jgi:HPt (histidine-containing phosphotransfer) domain-containing protein|nr:Hpt domain-containing protein [Lawsonibacter sp.]
MTIQECYAALEGDYEEVLGRLYSEALVKKFVGKFLADQSFQLLESSLNAEDYDEAFRAAHTLKGVAQNLSFTKLYRSSHEITEALRTKDCALATRLLPTVSQDYEQTVTAIQSFQSS